MYIYLTFLLGLFVSVYYWAGGEAYFQMVIRVSVMFGFVLQRDTAFDF